MTNPTSKLKLFDAYSRSIRVFEPINSSEVSVYACGPTVYDYAHIGNLRTYIFGDILRRSLSLFGYSVNHVMNITDVGHLVSDGDTGEDKMEKGARKRNQSAWEIALYFEEKFFQDLALLNIKKPSVVCRATEHIKEQIEYIQALEASGFTYLTPDGLYFDSTRIDDYGHLARLDVNGLREGERVNIASKRHRTDFALWKFSGDSSRQMEWESPWGIGFPGWHIECSAMAAKYLGPLFDIHLGGQDHIPVHHTNEIAQCQARHNTRMANYWMHGYFLRLDKEKISKSGRTILLSTLIENDYLPLAYRYLVLTSHYRKSLDFNWDSLKAANKALLRLTKATEELPNGGDIDLGYQERFKNHIGNDLSTPQALATLSQLIQDTSISAADRKATLKYYDTVLGLDLFRQSKVEAIPPEIELLAKRRQKARKNKRWAESDRLRDELQSLGYRVEDLAGGYSIKRDKRHR